MAPLTRNRATKSKTFPRTWVPNDLYVVLLIQLSKDFETRAFEPSAGTDLRLFPLSMCEYYGQRATDGGLIISEAMYVVRATLLQLHTS